jgi:hypothetical protein
MMISALGGVGSRGLIRGAWLLYFHPAGSEALEATWNRKCVF